MRLKRLFLGVMLLVGITGAGATNAAPEDISASISLKVPGNDAKQYPLALQKMQDGMYSCRASKSYRWPSSARWWQQRITGWQTAHKDRHSDSTCRALVNLRISTSWLGEQINPASGVVPGYKFARNSDSSGETSIGYT